MPYIWMARFPDNLGKNFGSYIKHADTHSTSHCKQLHTVVHSHNIVTHHTEQFILIIDFSLFQNIHI